jgi:tripartite-type tricarboxylate transporter receptor subunit TctC
MYPTRRRAIGLAGALCASTAPISRLGARAADWPSRPVRIVVPGGAGGVIDIRARWLAERLAPVIGQPIMVDNRPGAGGNLGTAAAAHSVPDGYTLLIVHQGTMAINPHLYARPGYDPLTDLVPITRLGVGPLVLAVHKDVPAHSVAELVNLARASPGKLSFNSPGIGTPPHLASALLQHLTGIHALHVPYKGGGQAIVDLVAGHVSWTMEGLTVLKPYAQDGRVRLLAVTSAHRVKVLPDLPTVSEAGVAGYEFIGWVGLAAPAGLPETVLERLYGAIAKVLDTVEARAWFEAFGVEPGGEAPAAFSAIVRAEHAKLGNVIRAAGIRIE